MKCFVAAPARENNAFGQVPSERLHQCSAYS